MQAEPLQVVVGSGERADLELAAIAGAGVHLADVQRAPEAAMHLGAQSGSDLLEGGIMSRGLGDDSGSKPHAQLADHVLRSVGSRDKTLTVLHIPNPRDAVK